MRKLYLLIFLYAFTAYAKAQSVTLTGECMTGTITLNKTIDVNGKPAYQGTGTVDGIAGVTVNVYWIGAPNNVWVIDYDGQPFFENACNRVWPPGTGNASCPTWSPVTGTTCDGPSSLAVGGSAVLPVSLTGFGATVVSSGVQLNWQTATEINNKGFDVQRSIDGATWSSIGFVNGAGYAMTASNYAYLDAAPVQGKNFYRLAQLDEDGRKTFTAVVTAEVATTANWYTLSSNNNGNYRLQIKVQGGVQVTVTDLNGRRLVNKQLQLGAHSLDISAYSAGVYVLQLTYNNKTITEKIINQ